MKEVMRETNNELVSMGNLYLLCVEGRKVRKAIADRDCLEGQSRSCR